MKTLHGRVGLLCRAWFCSIAILKVRGFAIWIRRLPDIIRLSYRQALYCTDDALPPSRSVTRREREEEGVTSKVSHLYL